MTRRAMRRRKPPPPAFFDQQEVNGLETGPRSDQWQREPPTWTPSVSEAGRWLASSFLQQHMLAWADKDLSPG